MLLFSSKVIYVVDCFCFFICFDDWRLVDFVWCGCFDVLGDVQLCGGFECVVECG